MVKNTIYKLKDNIDINEFGKLGYDILPDGHMTIIKFVPQDIDGELCQSMLQEIYNNPKWIERVYKGKCIERNSGKEYKNKDVLKEKIGLRYRNGKAVMTKAFKEILTMWRIQIESGYDEDQWVGFTCLDPFYTRTFYGKQILDKYCAEEIKTLLDKNLIEEIEVENEE